MMHERHCGDSFQNASGLLFPCRGRRRNDGCYLYVNDVECFVNSDILDCSLAGDPGGLVVATTKWCSVEESLAPDGGFDRDVALHYRLVAGTGVEQYLQSSC